MAIPVVEIDLSKFLRGMSDIPAVLTNAIRREIKYQIVEVQKRAMTKHRHITRTGMLNNSVQKRMLGDLEGEVYFDTGIAHYGVYVHEGHGAPHKSVLKGFPYVWRPDRFLYEALESRRATIVADLEKTIGESLASAGYL